MTTGNDNSKDDTSRDLRPGQVVFSGRFELKQILGQGGMGVVWLAHDQVLDCEVAIKFLPPHIRNDGMSIGGLKRETHCGMRLAHPNIVRTYDFLQDGDLVGMLMEYIDGDTLHVLQRDQPNGVFEVDDRFRTWMLQLCEAMAYVHEHAKLVHSCLKTTNLMVNMVGKLKLIDFGIARCIGGEPFNLCFSEVVAAFPSPQQLMGKPPSVSDDIYSLGGTLYALLTSKPPFYKGGIDYQVMHVVAPSMKERRKELGIQGAHIPAEWEDLVAACLAKHPAQRPQSMREVACMLGLQEQALKTEKEKILSKSIMSMPSVTRRRFLKWMPSPLEELAPWFLVTIFAVVVTVGLWFLNAAQIVVTSHPPFAKVRITMGERSSQQGTTWPLLGARFWHLEQGNNTVTITKPGYQSVEEIQSISSGVYLRKSYQLKRIPPLSTDTKKQ